MAKKKKINPMPEDFPHVSAHLVVADMRKALDFYQKAFGFGTMGPPLKAGRDIVHAVVTHGNGAIMLGPPNPHANQKPPVALKLKAQPFGLYVYVKDVDAHHKKVKRYKGVQTTAPVDTFWGDRMYEVVDRDGHCWTFASRTSIPTMEEMAEAMRQMVGG